MGAVKSSLAINDGMTPALRRINKAMSLMINNFEAVQRASGKAVNTADLAAARREIGAANALLDDMERNYRTINNQQEQLNNKINKGATASSGMLNKLKGVASAYLGVQAASKMIGLSDTLTGNRARLELIVDDGGSVAELEQKIYASAQRARAGFTDTMATVSKLGLVAGDAFTSNDEIIAFQELVNKNFVVGGASAIEQASAMYQLTQAMGSGRLQGDEYRSIIENAPLLAKSIEDYMHNVQGAKGSMKEWAAEGLLTADVIKAAVFNSATEVEERFKQMPMTWSQVWTTAQNVATKALDPVLRKINELANDKRVQGTVSGLLNAFAVVANILFTVFSLVCSVYYFIADNWSWISPIIYGIGAALLFYLAATKGVALAQTIGTAITGAYTAATTFLKIGYGVLTGNTAAASAAQFVYNSALLACPLTWILLIIIAVIAAIYAIIGAINKLTGSSISATGVIVGALSSAIAFIWNLVLGIFDLVLGVINYLINPFIEIANFIGNVFTNPVSSIIYLFQGMADNVLAILQKIASALDFVFGSNMADTVQGWRDGLKGKADALVAEYAPNENYQAIMGSLNLSAEGLGLKRWAYTDAWNSGYKLGENIEATVSDALTFDNLTKGADIPTAEQFANMGANLDDIAGDTASLAGSSDKTTEELSYLRDIAEKEAINRFTTAEVKVELGGVTNNVAANTDLDGVMAYITEGFVEALSTAAEGVHEDEF